MNYSVTIALVLATVLTMVFGELVPKNLAIAKPLATARAVSGFQRGFSAVTKPLLVFFGFVHPVKGVRELIDAEP